METKLPSNITKLLWDVDIKKVDPQKHASFIIERVVEYGDFPEIKWINSFYTKDEIVDSVKTSKRISPKTANFMSILYKIPTDQILCLRNPFTNKQDRF